MISNRTFCEECRKDVPFKVVEKQMSGVLKGEQYEYLGEAAICTDCESDVYVAEIEDNNLKALYDAYRKRYSIISLENILELPEKYGIGKRPLSLLLGWGEMTFSRYYDGDMPTKQYSDILQRLYDDPSYYRELLETHKKNLKSDLAYERSKRVTDDLLGKIGMPRSKLDVVIEYLLCICEDITPLALQKALYYVQGFYYAFMNEFLFDEDCEAWAHGPVYPEIYHRYIAYRFDPIEGNKTCNTFALTIDEITVIDSVIKNLCCFSGKTLENFTHAEQPWLRSRGDMPVTASSNRTIHKKYIGEYFRSVKEHCDMINPADIEYYSKRMFDRCV